MRLLFISIILILPLIGGKAVSADELRSYVRVVGSSTIRAFADAVADRVAKSGRIKRPLVESTGTAGGIVLFCEGVGAEYPDVANASRRISQSEFASCQSSGVTNIVEVKIGYGGVVLAHSHKHTPFPLARRELFLALANEVPDPGCPSCETLVPNPYKRWKEINPALPDMKIQVFGPSISSGTCDVFTEAVMSVGCGSFTAIAAKEQQRVNLPSACENVRDDGTYREAGGETLVKNLATNPDAVGIMGYDLFHQHARELNAISIEDVAPSQQSIASHRYAFGLPLFFYLKGEHVGKVAGLAQYTAEFTSEKAWGDKGYLAAIGLIPMSANERKAYAKDAVTLKKVEP